MSKSYKAMKEAFVSNHSGSSVGEINKVTLVASSSIFLWSVLQSRQRMFSPYTTAACLTDFLLNCIAILMATTLYSSTPLVLSTLLLAPALALYSAAPPLRTNKKSKPRKANSATRRNEPSEYLPHKPFVTMYRGSMMVTTCVAILAVDFRVFPRRFAKVETWGTSLMDLGVGSFVFSSGMVSARPIIREQLSGKTLPLLTRLTAAIKHSLPLLLLGFVRLYSVKGLDYAEHVTEYGVHWNFFFTLGFLPPLVALFQSVFRLIPSYALLSLIVAVSYEAALDLTDLTKFIISAPRTELISMNREGIFSFFGYLAIFLAGEATGIYTLPRESPKAEDPPGVGRPGISDEQGFATVVTEKISHFRRSILGKLAIWAVVWSSLFVFSTSYHGLGLQVSRRLANLPYFLWISAFNCGQIALTCGIEMLIFPDVYKGMDRKKELRQYRKATSRVLHAFNRNGLAIFLLANLLTGLVNIVLPTLHMAPLQAMGVLIAYISVLATAVLALDARDISIRL